METVRSIYYNLDTDTLDVWLGDPSSETCSEPLTENLVGKSNREGDVIGFEIITLGKLNNQDMRKLPANARALLKESANRFSVIRRVRK